MKKTKTSNKSELEIIPIAENQKGIRKHKKARKHSLRHFTGDMPSKA